MGRCASQRSDCLAVQAVRACQWRRSCCADLHGGGGGPLASSANPGGGSAGRAARAAARRMLLELTDAFQQYKEHWKCHAVAQPMNIRCQLPWDLIVPVCECACACQVPGPTRSPSPLT